MASSLNRAQIIGNLTRDPEVKQTPTGQTVATLGIATNRRWKDASGQLQEQVEYHNVVLWARQAEVAGQYLKKGSKVYIDGRLQTRTWEDPDGKKNYKTEIVGETMIFLDSKGGAMPMPDTGAGYSTPAASSAPMPSAPTAPAHKDEEIHIDDLPF